MKTRDLIGIDLDRAVAMGLGLEIYSIEIQGRIFWAYRKSGFEIRSYSTDISYSWPIIKEHKICIDAGDGHYKDKNRMWAAWPACNAPVRNEDEVTASDPLVAAMRAFVQLKFGDEMELP